MNQETSKARPIARNEDREQRSFGYHLTRGAPLAVMLAAMLYILYQLLPVLELVAVSTLLAVILRTVLRWLQKLVKSQWMAVLILAGFIIGFGVFLIAVVLPSLFEETQQLLVTLPAYLNSLTGLSVQLHQRISFVPDLSQGITQFRNFADQILALFPVFLREAFGATLEAVAMLILALYMAYDPNTLIHGIRRLIPRRHHQKFNRVLKAAGLRLRGWIFGTGIAMLFLGIGATIGLWCLGMPLALSFGVIAGLLEVIPYFGSIAGTFLPAIVALSISPLKFVFVLVLFLVLNQVDAHIVQPLVMSKQVHLHPVVVILTFLIMGKLFGFIGILLAVPAAAVMMTLLDEFTPQDVSSEEAKVG